MIHSIQHIFLPCVMQNNIASFQFFEITFSLLFTFFGAAISIWLLSRTVHEKKLSLRFLSDHIVLFSISALVVGRMGIFLFPLSYAVSENVFAAEFWYEKTWIYIKSFLSFWHGGIDLIWALGGFLIIFLFLCMIKNQKPLSWMDAFSLPSVLFFIFYALGTFFSGQNYGKPIPESSFPWPSVQYNLLDVQYSGPIHPVQLYEAILLIILLVCAWILWNKSIQHNWPNGIFGGFILSSLFFILFLLEFLRWNSSASLIFDFIPTQGLILFGLGFGIILFMIWNGHFWVFSRFKSRFKNNSKSE